MPSSSEARRKRLFFRCHHTGMKENDILIGAFADQHIADLSDDDVIWFEDFLMNNNDIDIYNWMVGNKPLPPEVDHPAMRLLMRSAGAS